MSGLDQHILAWRNQIYDCAANVDPDEELCWRSLAIGFFMARGLSIEEAKDRYEECVRLRCY